MEATSHYLLKVVDINTSNYGYLLKVSFVGPVVDDHYQFVYLPFARFPSVLMAEFLARKKEPTAELIDELSDAIRNDLKAQPGIVLFDTEEAARVQFEDAAGIDEQYDFADRPIADHDLQVFRQVFLGQSPKVRAGTRIDGSQVAYRVIDGNLHIDFGKTAVRDVNAGPTIINRESVLAIRDILIHRLFVDNSAIFSDRIIESIMDIVRDQPEAQRDIDHVTYIDRQQIEGGIKDIQANPYPLIILRAGFTGDRLINRKSMLGKMLQANRDTKRSLYIQNKYFWAKLKPMKPQYPTLVPREFYWGLRDLTNQLSIRKDHMFATRYVKSDATIIRETWLGSIPTPPPVTKPLHINYAGGFALRSIKADAYIERGDSAGRRSQFHQLYVPSDIIKGYKRTDRGLLLPKEQFSANRYKDRGLFVPSDLSHGGGDKAPKQLYIDSVQQRANRKDVWDAYVPNSKDFDGGNFIKVPYPAVMGEDFVGDKTLFPYILLEEEIIAQIDRSAKGSVLEELMNLADVKKRDLHGTFIEEYFWGSVFRNLPAHLLEDIIAWKGLFGDIMDDIFVGVRDYDGSSWLELAMEHGIISPEKFGILETDFFGGVRDRIQAIIDSEVTTGFRPNNNLGHIETGIEAHKEPNPADIGQELLGQEPPKPSQIHIENPLGFFEPKQSHIGQELLGQEPPKPSHIGQELLGQEPPKPSHIGQELLGQEPPKPSHIGQELLGQEPPKPSQIHIENPLGFFEPNPSWIGDMEAGSRPIDHAAASGEEGILGDQPDKSALLEEGTAGGLDKRTGKISSELIGDTDPRPSHIDEGQEMDRHTKYTDTLEDLVGTLDQRQAAIDESILADLQKRMAVLTTGFVFGELPRDRAGYVADIYFLGERSILVDGTIDDGEWIKFASLALHQAIIEEQMFGTDPVKASELLEHILAYTDPFPSHLNEDGIAEKQDHYADVITQIIGDKELAHAIIEDYLIAQQKIREGILPEPILGTEQLKQALLEEGPVGQSFVYDYISPDDILYQGDNPEFWEDGFGIPEDYDPHDPFNAYYPWAEELNTEILTQGDWIRFGPGTWDRNRDKGEFYAKSETEADGGYYRNDFNHTDYVFTIDFKVDEPTGDAAGIVFKYLDDKNYLKFSVYGDPMSDRNMALQRIVNGQSIWMGSPMNPFMWEQGRWYRLEVFVIGNRVKIKVNGRLQYDLVD